MEWTLTVKPFVALFVFSWILYPGHISDASLQAVNARSDTPRLENVSVKRTRQITFDGREHVDSSMDLTFWLPFSPKLPGDRYLIKLYAFGDVFDDTGSVLSTAKRRERITFLDKEEMLSISQNDGLAIEMTLDAPARNATHLKAITAKMDVTLARIVVVEFKDLLANLGKTLEHPKLKDIKIRLDSVQIEDGFTNVVLHLPKANVRLCHWELFSDKEDTWVWGASVSKAQDGGILLDKSFWGTNPKQYSLRLKLLEPIETKIFDLEFKDVKLP